MNENICQQFIINTCRHTLRKERLKQSYILHPHSLGNKKI